MILTERPSEEADEESQRTRTAADPAFCSQPPPNNSPRALLKGD